MWKKFCITIIPSGLVITCEDRHYGSYTPTKLAGRTGKATYAWIECLRSNNTTEEK